MDEGTPKDQGNDKNEIWPYASSCELQNHLQMLIQVLRLKSFFITRRFTQCQRDNGVDQNDEQVWFGQGCDDAWLYLEFMGGKQRVQRS